MCHILFEVTRNGELLPECMEVPAIEGFSTKNLLKASRRAFWAAVSAGWGDLFELRVRAIALTDGEGNVQVYMAQTDWSPSDCFT